MNLGSNFASTMQELALILPLVPNLKVLGLGSCPGNHDSHILPILVTEFVQGKDQKIIEDVTLELEELILGHAALGMEESEDIPHLHQLTDDRALKKIRVTHGYECAIIALRDLRLHGNYLRYLQQLTVAHVHPEVHNLIHHLRTIYDENGQLSEDSLKSLHVESWSDLEFAHANSFAWEKMLMGSIDCQPMSREDALAVYENLIVTSPALQELANSIENYASWVSIDISFAKKS